ncbi:MAG: 2-C-methyl-D-erythritol 4-phosphate cytidylyltransferase [Vicingaceae bacterium]|nr:2-C-methyl-D-erythritol 4-phosphate cytidylyltransferase [Vicingaceae bacterium]
MHKYAIIVAGGKGERMGENTPKQFLELKGKPILMHTIEKFRTTFQNIEIILALPENQIDFWEELCVLHHFPFSPKRVVKGGKTRFESVKNALTQVTESSVVAIHDGVRPLVSSETLNSCFDAAIEKGNAIPVVDVIDSLRHVSKQEGTNNAVTRSCYKAVQTPQCFNSELILKAYQQGFNPAFTDDASVVEKMGETINLVDGNTENIKITTQQDLLLAEALLSI